MSGLAGLIAGRDPAGVYVWVNASDIEDVRHTVEHAGFGFGHVDGWLQQDKQAVLAALGSTLGFPSYYGVNLDALADCLADVAEPTIVVWDGWTTLDEHDFAVISEIFAERAAQAPYVSLLLRSTRSDDALGRGLRELS